MSALEFVKECLSNAADNGYTFEGWTDSMVLDDIMGCTDGWEDFNAEELLRAVHTARSA